MADSENMPFPRLRESRDEADIGGKVCPMRDGLPLKRQKLQNQGEDSRIFTQQKQVSRACLVLRKRVTADDLLLDKDYAAAVQAYDAAIKIMAGCERTLQSSIHCNQAISYVMLKNWEGACAAAGRATKIEPKYAKAHYIQGLALFNLQRHQDCNRAFREVLKLTKSKIKHPSGVWFGKGPELAASSFLVHSPAPSKDYPVLPPNWIAKESRRKPGRYFYENLSETDSQKRVTWRKPLCVQKPIFCKPLSSSRTFF